ncbi:MAG: hypothetical protein EOO38_06700 [Cytophagaceae bacterium]|nr:MAG: hypothetical protein EOO38_06700 [Cytophagaceae bacterium]
MPEAEPLKIRFCPDGTGVQVPKLAADDVLTTYQVASLLKANISSVNCWTKDKGLQSYRTPGNHRRIVVRDLAAFLNAWNMPQPFVLTGLKP